MADDVTTDGETGGPAASSSAAGAPATPDATPAAAAGGNKLDVNNPKAVIGQPKKLTLYANKDWSKVGPSQSDPSQQEVAAEQVTYADGTVETYILDGSGSRYPTPASTTTDPNQRTLWENAVKDNTAAGKGKDALAPSSSVVEIDGKRYAITVKKDKTGNASYEYTDLQTNQPIPGLPTAKDKKTTSLSKGSDGKTYLLTIDENGQLVGAPTDTGLPADPKKGSTSFVKGGDGKTYAVPIDENGKAGAPVDTGIPPDAKPKDTFAVDTANGKQLVQVDKDGNATVVYSAPKDPTVKIEKDPKTGRWNQTTVDSKGVASVKEIQVEGAGAPKAPDMAPPPGVGQVSTWLWGEKKKLDDAVAAHQADPSQGMTAEEAAAEMDKRLDFAKTLVGEQAQQQATQDKTADRAAHEADLQAATAQKQQEDENANYRQGMSTAGSLFSSVAPGVLTMGSKLQPGNGDVAANGLMALLQLGQNFAQQMAGAKPRTTVAPDGTVTVDHNPTGAAAPAPGATPANAAVASAITGANSSEIAQPGDPGNPTIFGATPGQGAMGSTIPKPTPAFLPPPAISGAPTGPSTTVPGGTESAMPSDPSAVAQALVQQSGQPMASWAQQQAAGAPQLPAADDDSYMHGIFATNPQLADAWTEARRRDQMAVQAA